MHNLQSFQNISGFSNTNAVEAVVTLQSYIKSLSGLAAYYPLDETSGNAINQAPDTLGTLNGTVTGATQGATGQSGTAYSFDGVNDEIAITGAAAINLSVFTYTAIVFRTASGVNHAITGGSKGSGTRSPEFRMNTDNKIELLEQSVASIGVSTGTIAQDTWAHVAVSYSATGVFTFYINGVASGTGTNLRSFAYENHFIGRQLTAEWFAGKIQHYAIFNRVLESSEILQQAQLAGLA